MTEAEQPSGLSGSRWRREAGSRTEFGTGLVRYRPIRHGRLGHPADRRRWTDTNPQRLRTRLRRPTGPLPRAERRSVRCQGGFVGHDARRRGADRFSGRDSDRRHRRSAHVPQRDRRAGARRDGDPLAGTPSARAPDAGWARSRDPIDPLQQALIADVLDGNTTFVRAEGLAGSVAAPSPRSPTWRAHIEQPEV